MAKIAISSGHGLYVRGASGSPVPPQADEVDEARRVVDRVARYLESVGALAGVFHDNESQTQDANLDAIVSWHNTRVRDVDVSVHLNCYDGNAHGCEVLYVSEAGKTWAEMLSAAISSAGGFTDRGAKKNTNLAFLNGTDQPAVLLELYFCDHTGDCEKGYRYFEAICRTIASVLAERIDMLPIEPGLPPELPEDMPRPPEYLFAAYGRMSTFGGETDTGVTSGEGLAFFYNPDECPHLMQPTQPPNTSGMARRLDTNVFYVACRWDYEVTPKEMLRNQMLKAAVHNPKNGKVFAAFPADWGPNEAETGRAADLSPALADALGLSTDDEVEVVYPIST